MRKLALALPLIVATLAAVIPQVALADEGDHWRHEWREHNRDFYRDNWHRHYYDNGYYGNYVNPGWSDPYDNGYYRVPRPIRRWLNTF